MTRPTSRATKFFRRLSAYVAMLAGAAFLSACGGSLPPPPPSVTQAPEYHIGAGDGLHILVWQNADLSMQLTVRPDGMITLPLINDVEAAGKTPTQLAMDIQDRLKKYVTEPVVAVLVDTVVGPYSEQIRVVGEAAKPQAIPYRRDMTALDAMIAVGGLTQFAAGNRATLVRTVDGAQRSYRLRLDRLLQDGDVSANVPLEPGDVIIIPQTYF